MRTILQIEHVDYSWETEFDPPIAFLEEDKLVRPPFDWLVVAVRDGE